MQISESVAITSRITSLFGDSACVSAAATVTPSENMSENAELAADRTLRCRLNLVPST